MNRRRSHERSRAHPAAVRKNVALCSSAYPQLPGAQASRYDLAAGAPAPVRTRDRRCLTRVGRNVTIVEWEMEVSFDRLAGHNDLRYIVNTSASRSPVPLSPRATAMRDRPVWPQHGGEFLWSFRVQP